MEKKKKGFIANLTLDTEITRDQAIMAYAAITGNCISGIENYFKKHPEFDDLKTTTLRQMVDEGNKDDEHRGLIMRFFEKRAEKEAAEKAAAEAETTQTETAEPETTKA